MTDERNGLPELPKGWVWATLDEIAQIILGQSPPSSTYNEDGIGLPFYQGKAEFGDIYPSPRKWCSQPKKIAEKGDVLISVRAPVGPTNICPEKSCIGRGLAAIRGLDGIQSRFILYLMRSFENVIAGQGTGTTFNAITGSQLRDFEIPLPPLPEQHRIVAKIEELFTQLDAGVAALEKAKAQLRRYRQAVLKAAVEGELTREWREAHRGELEPASVLLERILEERRARWEAAHPGKRYRRPTPPETDDLPELPEGWTWARVADVGEVVTGRTPRKSRSEYYADDFPFYKPTDLNDGYYTRHARDGLSKLGIEKARLLPAKSTLVTCIGATIGKTGFIRRDGASNQQINAIVPGKGVVPEFIYFVCVSPQFQKSIIDHASATTLPILNKSRFEELLLPLPPPDEQQVIVEEIEHRLSVVDEMEKAVAQSLKRAERLRQSILKRAFEGKLVPQDPSDEPASVLLKRIKAEKARREAERKSKRKGSRKRGWKTEKAQQLKML